MKKIFLLFLFTFFSIPVYAVEKAKEGNGHTELILGVFSIDTLVRGGVLFLLVVVFTLVTIVIAKLLKRKIIGYIEMYGEGESREEVVGVASRVLDVTFFSLWAAIVLAILGVDIGIFMGGFGFGLGFTLKIFLSNFIGGIIMVTQDSYHNGDLIRIEDKMGYIKKINALFTEVEQFDGVIFYVPNVKFLENKVENFHKNSKRRVEIVVGVDYSTNLVKAKKIIMQVINNFGNILKAPEPEVIILGFENSAINLSVRFWIDSKGKYFVTKSNITETINLAFKQSGITIPFPQVTLSNRDNFEIRLKNK